ncbi:diguanylate cyclase domain-containing protein [Insolitispirillum peregrinum]|uniref:diguanylate cyclase domain-containing protein n=1 Tax=Insolitispirillum peregrinum TaxID=80876 RepID=UPI00361A1C46
MARRFSLSARMTTIAAILLCLLGAIAIHEVWTLHRQVAQERHTLARSLVEAIRNQIEYFHTLEIIGDLSRAEAQRQALQVIQAARFSDGNYLWVHDLDGNVLAHPLNPELVEQSRQGSLSPEMSALLERFNKAISIKDSATVSYMWPSPRGGEPTAKVSYLIHFEPWNWVIGSGVYLGDINQETRSRAWLLLGSLAVIAVLAIGVTLRLALGITRPLKQVTAAMAAVAAGDLDHPLPPVERNDEVGDLSRAMAIFCQQQRAARAIQLAHQEQQRLTSTVFNTIAEGVIVTDASGVIKAVNPSFTQLTGYQPEEAIGQTPRLFASGRHDSEFYRQMWDSLLHDGQWSGEIWNKTKEGRVFPEWLSIRAIHDDNQQISEYVAAFSDITQRKQQEERVQWFADHDSLTGLINRRAFDRDLPELVRNALNNHLRVAFLFIDLDRFKDINDTHGHLIGDRLLQAVAQRLRYSVRDSDLVARMGGDEFVIVLSPIHDRMAVYRLADTLVNKLAEPLHIEHTTLLPSASIGVLLVPDHAKSVDEALRLADQALYRAKNQGRNQWATLDGKGTVPAQAIKDDNPRSEAEG